MSCAYQARSSLSTRGHQSDRANHFKSLSCMPASPTYPGTRTRPDYKKLKRRWPSASSVQTMARSLEDALWPRRISSGAAIGAHLYRYGVAPPASRPHKPFTQPKAKQPGQAVAQRSRRPLVQILLVPKKTSVLVKPATFRN